MFKCISSDSEEVTSRSKSLQIRAATAAVKMEDNLMESAGRKEVNNRTIAEDPQAVNVSDVICNLLLDRRGLCVKDRPEVVRLIC